MYNDTPGNTPGTDYSLEDILAEFAKSNIPKPVASPAAPAPESAAAPATAVPPQGAPASAGPSAAKPAPRRERSARGSSRKLTLQELMASVTDEDLTRMAEQDSSVPQQQVREPAPTTAQPQEEAADIASGFRIGNNPQQHFRFGSAEIDAGTDDTYTPSVQETPPIISPRRTLRDMFTLERKPAPSRDKFYEKHNKKSPAIPEDASGQLTGGVPVEDAAPADPLEDFMSFGEYIRSSVNNVFNTVGLFFGGIGERIGTFTVEDDAEEDLGPESRPAEASRYYRGFIPSLKLRLEIVTVLLLVMLWVSLRLPVTGTLKDLRITALLCMSIQLTVMLACLDTVTAGIMNAFRKKPGAESLAVFFCMITTLDALITGKAKTGSAHVTLCLLSSLALTGVTYAAYLHTRAMNKSLTIPKKARSIYAVTSDEDGKGAVTLRRTDRSYTGFLTRAEEPTPDELRIRRFFLPAIAVPLFFALIVAVAKRNARDFLYIYSVLLCPTIPFTALLAFSWPFFTGAFRLFRNSSALAGWSGVQDIGHSKTLIITDGDIFPDGTIDIAVTRTISNMPAKRIISYAGTLMTAAGTGLAGPFCRLMEEQKVAPRPVEAFEILPAGGFKGVVDGEVVICGGVDVMRLMSVRLPQTGLSETSVCIAIGGRLCGFFDMVYTQDARVAKALRELMRSTRKPVFALRDFNITPLLLQKIFDINTDGFDFPPFKERFAMTDSAAFADNPVTALIACQGLSKITRMAETGHAVYTAIGINLLLNTLCTVTGMLVFFVKLLGAGISVKFMFLYLLLWALPVAILSFILPRI